MLFCKHISQYVLGIFMKFSLLQVFWIYTKFLSSSYDVIQKHHHIIGYT